MILCRDCQPDSGLKRPEFAGLVVFKGDYVTVMCKDCGDTIQ